MNRKADISRGLEKCCLILERKKGSSFPTVKCYLLLLLSLFLGLFRLFE